jgi:hypothetical protein
LLLGPGELPDFFKHVLFFKRGTGVDKTTLSMTSDKLNQWLVRKTNNAKQWIQSKLNKNATAPDSPLLHSSESSLDSNTSIHRTRYIERINLQTMDISLSTLFSASSMQEPTYERVIVLYRPKQAASSTSNGIAPIFIKQFKTIPMAGMSIELCALHAVAMALSRDLPSTIQISTWCFLIKLSP